MLKWLKDNIVLALGLSLPLLLVVLFVLAGTLSEALVDAPKYDVIFSDGMPGQFTFRIVEQKLCFAPPPNYLRNHNLPHLYRYRVITGKVQEINFKLPKSDAISSIVPVAELANVRLDNEPVSLDGYTFRGAGADGRDVLWGLRASASVERGPVISKSGRNILIPYTPPEETYSAPHFVGWVNP